jgi:hypothetical protein
MVHGLQYHCYADDTQLYISFSPKNEGEEEISIKTLENAIADVKNFMIRNKLKLNDEKTEFLILGSDANLNKVECTSIKIGDADINPSNEARNLGIVFDKNMSLETHVKNVCSNGFYHVRNLWKIRKFLSLEDTNIAAHAFVTSKLDYGNSLLGGAKKFLINKLQMVQNAAARAVTRTRKYDHISEKMRDLHWLPIEKRIKFKINLITWKALNGLAPNYIVELLKEPNEDIGLRSLDHEPLYEPKTNKTSMGDRAYSKVAPQYWNELPLSLRLISIENINSFKRGLKTRLFTESYSHILT